MIFPILKKIGYFLGGLLGIFMVVGAIGFMLRCEYAILSWNACGCVLFALLGVWTAYYYFSEFKKYNLKENIKCSRSVFWSEIKKIVKSVVYYVVGYLIFAFLAGCFICFVATIIWTITSFPEFLLHFIHYGPSTDLYNIIIPESFRAKPIEAIYFLMMAGVFAILCFFGAIFLIHRFLIKELYEFISEELDKINCKIDNVMKEVSKINKEGMQ